MPNPESAVGAPDRDVCEDLLEVVGAPSCPKLPQAFLPHYYSNMVTSRSLSNPDTARGLDTVSIRESLKMQPRQRLTFFRAARPFGREAVGKSRLAQGWVREPLK